MKTFDINKDSLEFDFGYNIEETEKLKELFNNKENVTIDDLRRISLWKINRVLDISDSTLEKLNTIFKENNLKYNDDIVVETIQELVNSKGVGFPMMSSILKFLRPDTFPIIDFRAYRALYGKKISYSQYKLEIYFDYIKKIYEIRDKLNIELNKIDEQLYEFDRIKNKKN